MSHFTIVPTKDGKSLPEISAMDEPSVLFAVSNLQCDEAAIFEGDVYRFSLRLDPTGTWTIFEREIPPPSRRF